MFFSICIKASNEKQRVLKSFNFKLYYTEGGEKLARQLINEAENSLESIENFLGARLVEQIDILLSESPIVEENKVPQRNGNIILDNSSIYLYYCGNAKTVTLKLKERLAEILINGMLYGNTVKERLKNNREINVPDWYVSGLAKYVSGNKAPNTSWMADYYEGKLKLNLNLTDKNELAEFGHSVFNHINDSFGINKLRQILFYTKISGKTDYAFQYVLNKSLNWVIADWFKLEKEKYLKESNKRLPNDPEPISNKLKTADLIDIKFSKDGNELNFLIQTFKGIELWNYDISSHKSINIFKAVSVNKKTLWAFEQFNNKYILIKSNGYKSDLMVIDNGKVERTLKLDFNYILSIKAHPVSGLAILAQTNYQIDVFQLQLNEPLQLINLTDNLLEETDFTFSKNGNLIISFTDNKNFRIKNTKLGQNIYISTNPMYKLNLYKNNYLSFIQSGSDKNTGIIVNMDDTSQTYQVTNYTRSVIHYDYNSITNKVVEELKYGKINYIVISEASIDSVKTKNKDTSNIFKIEPQKTDLDTSAKSIFSYKFITGFEYKTKKTVNTNLQIIKENKTQPKVKEYFAPQYEFKPSVIRFGYTNSQFNSPFFANFFPIGAGLNNGANIIVGCKISDVFKKYSVTANIRQPLNGKGTDLDFLIRANNTRLSYGIFMFNSIYQKELYNQSQKITAKDIKFFIKVNWHPQFTTTTNIGFRADILFPLSISAENLRKDITKLRQPYIQNTFNGIIWNKSKLNYSQNLSSVFSFLVFKPLHKSGVNTNLYFNLKFDQTFFRIFRLSTRFNLQSSVGKQKTVWLMGGVSNWLRPVLANASVFNTDKIGLYSSMDDFAGLPYNYKAGTSVGIAKMILSIPINPIISQQNFNQNFFKYLTIRSYVNLGTAWFGQNPFSITNPENKDIYETGSITITNYVAKNPLVWSWGAGANSVLFGYEIGFDYAIGYNERGQIGKFWYLTVGKEF